MDMGWTSHTENVHDDALCETLETKARSFAEDHGRKRCPGLGQRWLKSRSNTIKANSKIVKERIWTLDSHFASKIMLQSLETDTDAQLHKERVISVRKEAGFAS